MTDLDLFRSFDAEIRQAQQYAKWGQSNPGERTKYEAFADAIKAGQPIVTPTLTTHFGAALVMAGWMALEPAPVPDPAPTGPTGPPPPTGGTPTVVIPAAVIPAGVTRVEVAPGQLASLLSSAPDGAWLVLRAGNHDGSHTITKRHTVIGAPGEKPVVRGRFRVQGTGAKLTGFALDGATVDYEGIWIERPDVVVELMEIRNTKGDGIFGGGLRAKVLRNWIHHCGRLFTNGVPQKHGVYWAGGSDGLVEENVIEDNQGHGVQLHPYSASTGIMVRRNTILRNGSQAWGAHQGASGIIFDAYSAALGATADGNIVAWHAKECGIRKLGVTSGQVVKGNCAWQNAQGSFPKVSAFYGAGLVDGGGNVEQEPFTLASAAYGSPLYVF